MTHLWTPPYVAFFCRISPAGLKTTARQGAFGLRWSDLVGRILWWASIRNVCNEPHFGASRSTSLIWHTNFSWFVEDHSADCNKKSPGIHFNHPSFRAEPKFINLKLADGLFMFRISIHKNQRFPKDFFHLQGSQQKNVPPGPEHGRAQRALAAGLPAANSWGIVLVLEMKGGWSLRHGVFITIVTYYVLLLLLSLLLYVIITN